MATQTEIVEGVKAYATEHYEEGFDFIVETMEDAEIEAFLFSPEGGFAATGLWKPRTVKGAVARFAPQAAYRREMMADAKISAGETGVEVTVEKVETAKERKARLARERRANRKVLANA